jgi:hypothetical protein
MFAAGTNAQFASLEQMKKLLARLFAHTSTGIFPLAISL